MSKTTLLLLLFLFTLLFFTTPFSSHGGSRFKSIDRLGSSFVDDSFFYKNENPTEDSKGAKAQQKKLVIEDNDENQDREDEQNEKRQMSEEDEKREYGYITNLKEMAKNENQIYIEKIILEGVSVFSKQELEKVYEDSLKRKYTLPEFKKMLRKISRFYRKNGYILARATVPDQQMTNSTVKIQIFEGIIDDLIIKNDETNPVSEVILNFIKKQMFYYLKIGSVLNKKNIETFLVLANQLPGTSIKSVLSPSTKKVGGAVLTVITRKISNFQVDYQLNNHGNSYIGKNIAQLSGKFYNPFVVGTLSGNVLKTTAGDGLLYGQLSWQQYLYESGLKLILSYDKSKTHPTGRVSMLNLRGESNSWMAGITLPWEISFNKIYSFYLKLNQFKGSLMLDSVRLAIYDDRIDSLRIGNNFSFYGSTQGEVQNLNSSATINILYSRGLKFNTQENKNPSRVQAEKEFNKINAEATFDSAIRKHDLSYGYSMLAAVATQKSFSALLASEEMSFGGQEYGRGYDSGTMSGDSGIMGKLEFHLSISSGDKMLIKIPLVHNVDLYTFFDTGKLYNQGITTTQEETISASSAGIGANLFLFLNFYTKFFIAKPLTRNDQNLINDGKDGKGIRLFFSLGGSF
ncbi:MAG: ShlB/FhaC/HecB family hemolysin secretion/activation protein [Oligoflexia bacterium]|nr:ShlB/FhaC/HecB family hemolysin secretion/activation protein [Oligoflexia bacterium]